MDDTAAAAGPAPFAPEDERDFQQAMSLLVSPPALQQQKTRLLLVSLAAFVAVTLMSSNPNFLEIVTLVGVILFHEVGHMIAMRLAGYRDVRIFFIPFFGGAAAGKKRGVARWKEAVVLLCGPLPGLIVGTALALLGATDLARVVVFQLIVVNALNLLPIAPLDGGQLFQVLVFSRQRHLELVFVGVTAVLLGIGGGLIEAWGLVVLAGLVLASLPQRKRVLDVAHAFRDRGLSSDPAALDETQRRDLYRATLASLPPQFRQNWRGKPQPQAQMLDQILERATQKPPSGRATTGLLALWFGGLVIAVVGLAAAVGPRWRPYTDDAGQFAVEMPAAPVSTQEQGFHGVVVTLRGDRAFAVLWNEVPDPASALARVHDEMARHAMLTDLTTGALDRTFTYHDGKFFVTRLVASSTRIYIIGANGPQETADARRFVSSFRLLGR